MLLVVAFVRIIDAVDAGVLAALERRGARGV